MFLLFTVIFFYPSSIIIIKKKKNPSTKIYHIIYLLLVVYTTGGRRQTEEDVHYFLVHICSPCFLNVWRISNRIIYLYSLMHYLSNSSNCKVHSRSQSCFISKGGYDIFLFISNVPLILTLPNINNLFAPLDIVLFAIIVLQ